jgi:transcriptional regulator with XRE-family HTH domain
LLPDNGIHEHWDEDSNMEISARPAILRTSTIASFGEQLRQWRARRCLTQMQLAAAAEISIRHLSFIETGRANPSREMVLRLSSQLRLPLRERNTLLVAAGYAPTYRESRLEDPSLEAARKTIDLILKGHEPFPALAIDRHWNMVAANRMVPHLLRGIDASLTQAPVNVMRLALHPLGLAPRIVNLAQWRSHSFERLQHQIAVTGDPQLTSLLTELHNLPGPVVAEDDERHGERVGFAVPLQVRSRSGLLNFISTTTVFGSPVDVTLQELALETFFPLDDFTMQALRKRAAIELSK